MRNSIFTFLFVVVFSFSANAAYDIFEVENKGLNAWYLKDDLLPIVSIELSFDKSGYAYDPKSKQGLAYFVASMLNEGAGRFSAKEYQRLLDENAISFRPSIDEDYFYISIKTLSENLPLALEMVNAAITNPHFGDAELETVRGQTISYIKKKKENSRKMAFDELTNYIFKNHPYSNTKEGSVESVEGITKAEMHSYIKNHFTKDNVKISIVGNVNKVRTKQILKSLASSMPEKSSLKEIVDFESYPESGDQNISIDNPQTIVMFASKGIKRSDPDFYAAYVLNHIIGGSGFQAILHEEVREKRGLTYYIGTQMKVLDHANLFVGTLATTTDQVKEAKEVVRQTLREIEAEGITQEQLNNAKSYITGSFPLNLDMNTKIANYLSMMQSEGLGPDYLKNRNNYINSVTLEQINEVAKKMISAESLIFLTVGK